VVELSKISGGAFQNKWWSFPIKWWSLQKIEKRTLL